MLRFVSVVCCVAGAALSLAGSYSVSYSGGTATDSTGTSRAYALANGSYSGDATVYGLMGGTATCQGQVTATFAWNGGPTNDPPPSFVVFSVTSSANASQDNGIAPIALADDGLGDASTGSSSNRHSGGTHFYTKNSPGQSFTYSWTPFASFYAVPYNGFARTTFNPPPLGTCRVSCSAQIAGGVTLHLSGGVGSDATHKYLVGQQCIASLTLPTGWTASSYTWTPTGGAPFADYTADINHGTFTAAAATQTTSQFSTYFAQQDTVALKCVVTLTSSNGTLPAGGMAATVQSTFSVVRPSATAQGQDNGQVDVIPTSLGQYIKYITRPDLDQNLKAIVFSATVTTPSDFTFAGQGEWNYIQIIHYGRTRVAIDGITETLKTINGYTDGLDSVYPYEPSSNPDVKSWPADGAAHVCTDDPSNDLVQSEATSYAINEPFDVYVMYRAPGATSKYVPLHTFNWKWGGSTQYPGGSWGAVSGHGIHEITYSSDAYQGHPTWVRAMHITEVFWLR